MPVEIPTPLVEFILLGPVDDRRQLQDSPILGDVWIEYAKRPDQPLDLLITPNMTTPANAVAAALHDRFNRLAKNAGSDPQTSYLQGIVAARLHFRQLLRIVVPMTHWFSVKVADADEKGAKQFAYDEKRAVAAVTDALELAKTHFRSGSRETSDVRSARLSALDRYTVMVGLILWADHHDLDTPSDLPVEAARKIAAVLTKAKPEDVAKEYLKLVKTVAKDPPSAPVVWNVSRNRPARLALTKSVAAVKADAAANLFKVDCGDIGWAVLDSGIDATHPAFSNRVRERARIRRCFDFTKYRRIVNLSNSDPAARTESLRVLLAGKKQLLSFDRLTGRQKKSRLYDEHREKDLKELAKDAQRGGAIDWELVENFVEVVPGTPPLTDHGTHVAGIIGASKENAGKDADSADGMCPTISLYDFRVVGASADDTEFAMIAALQYIRYLNDRDNFLTIHGANLSLSIPHDVRNFACGSTPICIESERLVESGVVVVAAAGNQGYKSFETKDGAFESYAAFSITDPGNADGVITVGATHRHWPHTYGVSFFSSRGPTGDGRLKPDLVAPGERIRAPLPGGEWGDLDGTSMAAPHVSGAAAMLMARYSELIGHPARIKKILCENATDLGRERSFQGRGMLDVLRAFQSI